MYASIVAFIVVLNLIYFGLKYFEMMIVLKITVGNYSNWYFWKLYHVYFIAVLLYSDKY